MFKNIGLITKRNDTQVKKCLETLVKFLLKYNLEILIDAPSAELLSQTDLNIVPDSEALGNRCDLVIVIGGDGTLLQAARLLAKYDVRLLGVNLGRLGFLADICPTAIEKSLAEILGGIFIEENRFLLYAQAYRDDQCVSYCNALNDITIHRGNMSHMLIFETLIDGHFVNCQRADGLVVSTPTGSTAYALSADGPIIHPSLNALVLVTICPHTLTSRPLVIDADSCVELHIALEQRGEAQLNGDGALCQTLMPGDRVVIKKYQHISLIHPQGHDHYATLRAKLDWSKSI